MDHLVLRHLSYRRGFTYTFSISVHEVDDGEGAGQVVLRVKVEEFDAAGVVRPNRRQLDSGERPVQRPAQARFMLPRYAGLPP
jgi:hypothetical protein